MRVNEIVAAISTLLDQLNWNSVQRNPYFNLSAQIKFCPCFLVFSSVLDWLSQDRCPLKCTDRLRVSWKSAQWKPYLTSGIKRNYTRVCDVKPTDNVEVKNALLRSVHYIKEHAILNLVSAPRLPKSKRLTFFTLGKLDFCLTVHHQLGKVI